MGSVHDKSLHHTSGLSVTCGPVVSCIVFSPLNNGNWGTDQRKRQSTCIYLQSYAGFLGCRYILTVLPSQLNVPVYTKMDVIDIILEMLVSMFQLSCRVLEQVIMSLLDSGTKFLFSRSRRIENKIINQSLKYWFFDVNNTMQCI